MPAFSGTIVVTSEYCTVSDLKTYLGITVVTDDVLLTNLIARAQKAIEVYTGRVFKCTADTARNFTVGIDTAGLNLWFGDADLCQFASTTPVVTDADGGAHNLTRNTDFVTQPRNTTPWYGLKLLDSCTYGWEYTNDPELGVTITGRWAYSITPPDDIIHACLRLAAYYYRQKDASVFDTTALPDAGVMMIPQGIPKDVKLILDAYVRPAL